eukprot:CAMPEP_0114673496 /NCGR_PEP_ID=MMETSP0191-20121206/44781_1 /TAXON_ID=126664 /ORGANISM="Sorites sp." /LENGTH=179 /DNA_ID=CAMNT_0001938527 /DNA_START=736 /DNA_END=1276 /DNA_ORIENTATION=+
MKLGHYFKKYNVKQLCLKLESNEVYNQYNGDSKDNEVKYDDDDDRIVSRMVNNGPIDTLDPKVRQMIDELKIDDKYKKHSEIVIKYALLNHVKLEDLKSHAKTIETNIKRSNVDINGLYECINEITGKVGPDKIICDNMLVICIGAPKTSPKSDTILKAIKASPHVSVVLMAETRMYQK